jgi:hypothetical protein
MASAFFWASAMAATGGSLGVNELLEIMVRGWGVGKIL